MNASVCLASRACILFVRFIFKYVLSVCLAMMQVCKAVLPKALCFVS